MKLSKSTEEVCRRIYEETKAFYWKKLKGPKELGFQILYGPPFGAAPIMFLGYQPGKSCKDASAEREYGSEDRYPEACEYATECWPLAARLQETFGVGLLRRSVGLNAIFVRSKGIADYYSNFSSPIRQEIRGFCVGRATEIIKAVRPKKIVLIGFSTLDLFPGQLRFDWREHPPNARGRLLTKVGTLAGYEAIATLHLTGARISNEDRNTIVDQLRGFCA